MIEAFGADASLASRPQPACGDDSTPPKGDRHCVGVCATSPGPTMLRLVCDTAALDVAIFGEAQHTE
jgi:hypothetical protein